MNGAILINKPKDLTSRDVINRLNQILEMKQIGHTGTLDPMATGLLICLVGKATKLVNLLTNEDKEYIASFLLGKLTDTLDITGKVIKESNKQISIDEIKSSLKSFIGTYNQEVPIYSAVKINGKKLYEYARNNEKVILPKRLITIYIIELLNYQDNEVTIKVKVSKGTYIRSLIRDIGSKLGTYACMSKLERTKVGNFNLEDASSIEDILHNNYHLYSIEELLHPDVIECSSKDLIHIQNGNIIKMNKTYVLFKYQGKEIVLYHKYNEEEMKPVIIY